MSVVVGAASRTSAAIAGDSAYFRLVNGRPVAALGWPKVLRAGAHVAGIAGVADFAGCDFIAALAQAMSSIAKVDDLPQRFLEIAGPSFPAAFNAWLDAGVFALDQPERFFEAIVAW